MVIERGNYAIARACAYLATGLLTAPICAISKPIPPRASTPALRRCAILPKVSAQVSTKCSDRHAVPD